SGSPLVHRTASLVSVDSADLGGVAGWANSHTALTMASEAMMAVTAISFFIGSDFPIPNNLI
ncbi:MAG: hypothetical protein JZU63_03665, partial [Rhodoferax sp.]|nr:hypothetical protein [Rhodoferax sp.]